MRRILCTVGTSLLTNLRRSGGQNSNISDLLSFIQRQGDRLASAETNSLSRIIDTGDEICLLYSHTEEGRICAEALQQYYNSQGIKAEIKEIASLNYAHHTFASEGLKSLINSLIYEIRISRLRNLEPVINATGGFKAEIAYATLVGLIFKVQVYYIHEVFQDIIIMPPLPVDWDACLFVENEDFFDWISKDFRTRERVINRLQGLPEEINLFLEEYDERYITLSAAGTVYYEAFCDLRRQAADIVMISRQAESYYNQLDSTVKDRFDMLIKRLTIDQVRKSQVRRIDNAECVDYPASRPTKERIFFYDDGEKIYICELARHGDNYENLLRKGVKKDDYREFREMKVFKIS